MSALPRVAEATHERVSRELDERGPAACLAQSTERLRMNNPEVLDMATRCARDLGNAEELLLGFAVFYRLLAVEAASQQGEPEVALLDPLPHVTPHTRALIAQRIDEEGAEGFTRGTIEALEHENPELLRLAHRFAERQRDYLGAMQGFALLYACLRAQHAADRSQPH